MSYLARTQQGPLATARSAHAFAFFASSHFQLSSSEIQARYIGHPHVRHRAPHPPAVHHPAHHRQHLPPGIEEQPF